MKSEDTLVLLAKSLRKGERSAFRRWVKGGPGKEGSKYLALLDHILASKGYNEKKARREMGFEQKKGAFSTLKSYLNHLLLDFLRNSMQEDNSAMKFRRLLDQVEILRSRNLYIQARKVLRKAEKMADVLEKPSWQIACVRQHFSIIFDLREYESEARLNELMELFRTSVQKLNLDFEITENFIRVAVRRMSNTPFDAGEDIKTYDFPAWLESKLDPDKLAKIPRDTRRRLFTTMGNYYLLTREWEKANTGFTKVYEIYQTMPLSNLDPMNFGFTLFNLCICALQLNDPATADKWIEAFAQVHAQFANSRHEPYLKRIPIMAEHLRQASALLKRHWQGVVEAKSAIRKLPWQEDANRMQAYFDITDQNAAIGYFFLGRHKEALAIVNEMLNRKTGALSAEFRGNLQVLNLMIHDELGNTELLDYLLRNFARLVEQETEYRHFRVALLDYLKRKQNLGSNREKEALLRDFCGEMEAYFGKIKFDLYGKDMNDYILHRRFSEQLAAIRP